MTSRSTSALACRQRRPSVPTRPSATKGTESTFPSLRTKLKEARKGTREKGSTPPAHLMSIHNAGASRSQAR